RAGPNNPLARGLVVRGRAGRLWRPPPAPCRHSSQSLSAQAGLPGRTASNPPAERAVRSARRWLEPEPETVQGAARIGRVVDADHRRTPGHLAHAVCARHRLPRAGLTPLLVAPRDRRQDEREEGEGPQRLENGLDFRSEDSHLRLVLPSPRRFTL